ncbi:hypothetical protein KP509_11G097600 [Ceratopteris richardii]|uniref:Uncharacterized protein n=1 Tax=Ceratopteris richardii TaxID=49495 RepID=A0A8T2TSG8_CERRI|nr:hypothetical protein KP509_11G097600 [Ceratopteris richardii]
MDSSKSTEKHPNYSIIRFISSTADASTETVVLNSTCWTMALRKKHRDVWEGVTFVIAPGESLLVRWTTLDPWERLGAIVMSDASKPSTSLPCALLISVHTLASSSIVSILHSSNSLEAHSVPRPASNP